MFPGQAGALGLCEEIGRLRCALERVVPEMAPASDPDLADRLAACLRRTSAEIEALAPAGLAEGRLPGLGAELDAIRRETGDAVARIVEAADALLSHDDPDPDAYRAAVAENAIAILEACCVGDITNQRIVRALDSLGQVADRLRRFAETCGDAGAERATAQEALARETLLFGPGETPADQAAVDAAFGRATG